MKRTTTKKMQIKQVFEVFVVVTISHTQKKLTKIFYYYFVPPVADIIVCNVFGSKVSVLLTSQISKWLTLSMCFQHWSRYCWVFRPSWRCCWSDKTQQYFKYNLYWTSPRACRLSQVHVFGTHMFSLSLQVLWVPHQLPIHFVPHVLSNDLSLTCVVIQLIQYGVEWQTGCEPAEKKNFNNEENGKHYRFTSFIYFYWHNSINGYF